MPIGALGGKKEFMSVFTLETGPKVKHSGTFTANPMSMHAGYVGMSLMTPDEFDRLERLARRLREGVDQIRHDLGIPGYIEGVGSTVAFIMNETRITNWRELAAAAAGGLLQRIQTYGELLMDEGLATMRGGFVLSTPMNDDTVDFTLQGVQNALSKMKDM